MRRRVVREVGTIAGVVVILGALIFTNSFLQRSTLAEQMVTWREALEKQQEEQGQISLLKWPLLQETTGGYSKGPTFAEELKPFNGQEINIMGFQVPVEQFRDMTEFLLLPMPIECYFCQAPPMKDVVLVQMAKDEVCPLFKEPVLISGTLELHQGPKTEFFYVIKDAHWAKSAKDMKYHRKNVPIEHQLPHDKSQQEPMMEGTQLPQAPSTDDVIKGVSAPVTDAPATAPATPSAEAPAAPAAPETAPVADGPVAAPAEPPAAAPEPAAPEAGTVPPSQ